MNEGRLPPEFAKLSTTALSLTRELWGQAVLGRDLRMTLAESSSSSPGGWSIATIIFIRSSVSWFQWAAVLHLVTNIHATLQVHLSRAPLSALGLLHHLGPSDVHTQLLAEVGLTLLVAAGHRLQLELLGELPKRTLRGTPRTHPWKASPVWVWLCLSRLAWVQRVLPQRWPRKAFLPMCIRRCRLRSASRVKLWLQNSHTDGLSFQCRLSLFQAGAPIPCTWTASPQGAQKPPAAATPLGHEALGRGDRRGAWQLGEAWSWDSARPPLWTAGGRRNTFRASFFSMWDARCHYSSVLQRKVSWNTKYLKTCSQPFM